MSNLTGTSFIDVNRTGVFDPGDLPIANAAVFTDLPPFDGIYQPDQGERSAITGQDGSFVITDLQTLGAGTPFQLQQIPPADGSVSSPGNNLPLPFTVPADPTQNIGPVAIANLPPDVPVPSVPPITSKGNIQGRTFVDNNVDGIFNLDEPVVGGIPLFLDLDGNGAWTANEPITVSRPDGSYSFNNLTPGTYQLRPLLPGNDVPPGLGGVTSFADRLVATNDDPKLVNVSAGAVTFQDLGYVVPGSIYGFVVSDLNSNGVADPGEAGIPGITVSGGGRTAVTDANGFYILDVDARFPTFSDAELAQNPYLHYVLSNEPGLLTESFAVEVVNPPGNLVATGPDPDFDVALGRGGAAQKNFFFNVPPSLVGGPGVPDSITGFVFTDVNIDSAYQVGEPLLEGVTVYLDLNKDGQLNSGPLRDPVTGAVILDPNGNPFPAEPSTVTGPGGNFGFFNVSRWLPFIEPGDVEFQVRVEAPASLPFVTTPDVSISGEGLGVLAEVGASGVAFGMSQFPV
ncbi:MAG: SdrD B-like domain-containing protein [Limnospira sp. PMC 1291.21]|uniref:SdrD B-like domain-containing protein n=1 Tax=Limnospira TaxID=2596745 RepID=UPI00144A1D58|nr:MULTISPECIES: SdrD B-like domain-containing protein [unclassified Limnospira]QJB24567.1 Cna B-type [Limnospira fusiformis SAG 85.79]MDT9179344.1 SdrD B-like domain-containing protein [Limnospira sp. PMC 1238.20]MDT9191731.1 SdrD B-like domain-containing protein [Limnospira sp. PMC 1245.20]MDT9204896.1 SdrD B-like domain-containing protein [Limnospira sp. PMC 1243.20]MDT9209979.1 SdrD B-like domain-containing protein [Limnospira sp. PMC 1252.20]